MAIGRISIKHGKKGKALPHFKYIMALDKYTKKQIDLSYCEIGNMPDWAKDNPSLFWEMADLHERENGSTYREHILTLPREFSREQNLSLIKDWLNTHINPNNLPYAFSIHNPLAQDGKPQPHCHLMFCERINDNIERPAPQFFKRYNSKNPQKGGAKKTNTGLTNQQRQEQILAIRNDWGDKLNSHLYLNGYEPNIDMRNWQERGLSEPPKNKSMEQIQIEKKLDKFSSVKMRKRELAEQKAEQRKAEFLEKMQKLKNEQEQKPVLEPTPTPRRGFTP